MKELQEKILKEGQAIGSEIIKVDGFLNHQMDVALINNIGKEFAKIFAGEKIDKILTVEASGIAVAFAVANALEQIPVVFAKKAKPSTLTEGFFVAEAKSFTKGTVSNLVVSEKFLEEGKRVLIIDDFLAHGEAAMALVKILNQAKCTTVGLGAVIEKGFQGGRGELEKIGVRVESTAIIKEIKDGEVEFL